MKKRILSLLLVACMLVGLLPTTAFAAESDEAAQQFALYMSELGLVDDSGQLIQDNTFTVEDGTKLGSLDALLDWLDACEEEDMDTLITVDATGKTVTADLLLQAISVESQVGLLANTLSLLATDTSTTVVSPHSLHLVQKASADGDIVTFRVGVSASENGEFVAAPHDIQIQSGLFVNRIDSVYDQVAVDRTRSIPVNGYITATLFEGNTYIEYKLDLNKLRKYFNGEDNLTTPWDTYGHVLGENGHWLGYESALFQSRVVSGAPEQSVQSYFKFAPFSGISEVLTNVQGNYKVADTANSAPVVFSFEAGKNYDTTTIGNKSYFSFTPTSFRLTDADGDGSVSYSPYDRVQGAWYLGAGDSDHSIIIEDAYALLKVDNGDNKDYFAYETYVEDDNHEEVVRTPRNFDLYRNDSGDLTKIADGTSLYQYDYYTAPKASMAEDIAVAVSGKWSYDSNDKDMKAIYDALMKEADVTDFTKNTGSLNQRRIGLYFSDLKISIGPDDDSQNLFPILAFETNSLKTPLTFATGGKITISDTTAPTVKNVYIQSRDTDFRPGDVIPILVEFSEPVQGNYILYNGATQVASSSVNIENYYGTVTTNNFITYSNLYVFYYTVQPGDTGIRVSKVSAGQGNNSAMDTFGNYFSNVTFETPYTLGGHIRKASVKDTIASVSATVDQYDPTQMTVTVNLKSNNLTGQLWGNWNQAKKDNNYDGTKFDGLDSAQAIAALRGQLSLMESISINSGDYDWNYVNDMFQWSTTESAQNANITDTAKKLQEIVSINYRQGSYYEPLENFSYLYYIPKALMMLCGLSEGSTTVTAQHASLPSLSSSVTVNVEMLKNKLYLFQFTPAVQTTVSYEDGKGNTHTVVSNSDGSLALYEPNGIASDLRCASAVGDEIYRGTASMLGDTFNVNLKSGEGNGVYDELYPLNAVKLQPAASMELTIFRPDGEPLKNAKVTLRGGVYRNLDQVTDAFQRDTAYCPNAKFSTTNDDTADLNGREDQVFTTDGNGVLRVYMDSTQFKRNASDSEPDQSDLIRFVFELRFANDEYQPELVEFDTRMTQSDVIRSGGNLLTLTAASGAKPVIATQTVDYYTGREINVRRHTGVVGPSADYTTVRLSTRMMLWGMEQVSTQDTGYSFDVRAQETAVKLSGQTHTNARTASYPFSSIPLLENVTLINTDSFGDFKATTRIPMELVLYNGRGAMERTLTLPFGLIDMTAVEKVSESESVIGLMTRLTAAGSSVYPKLDNKVLEVADDLIDALSLLEGVGAKLTITAADGSTTRTYTIYLNPENSGTDYYTLNFETNGGSKITALRKSSGTTVDLTAYTPTRSGYIFTGWYADKALTEKITELDPEGFYSSELESLPPERAERRFFWGEDGHIHVKNLSAFWIPELTVTEVIHGTTYVVTGSYEGTENFVRKLERITSRKFAEKLEDSE